MFPQPMVHDWARRLIAIEADADPLIAQSEAATLRVYENLRRQLCAPVGVDGFQALASRALSMAKPHSPSLSGVQVLADGDLSGLGERGTQMPIDEDGGVGVILIAQLLGLFLTLLGEAATIRLVEGQSMQSEFRKLERVETSKPSTSTSYLGPFQDIVLEAEQLRHVSKRLEILADTHAGIDELMSVAGNIRSIATVLDVFTLIRSDTGGTDEGELPPPTNGYLN